MSSESQGFAPDPSAELDLGLTGAARPPNWLESFDAADRAEFFAELDTAVDQARAGDPRALEVCVLAWKSTGVALLDPVALEILTAESLDDDNFGEVGPPGAPPLPQGGGRHRAGPAMVTVSSADLDLVLTELGPVIGIIPPEVADAHRRLLATLDGAK